MPLVLNEQKSNHIFSFVVKKDVHKRAFYELAKIRFETKSKAVESISIKDGCRRFIIRDCSKDEVISSLSEVEDIFAEKEHPEILKLIAQ